MIVAMRSWTLAPLAVVLLGALGGCLDDPLCEGDDNSCADDSTLVEDPTCELTDALEIEIGEGQDVYSPLAAGELPEVYNGFQGGQHVWLGVRVKNPDLDHSALQIAISLSDCETECVNPQSWSLDNDRTIVVGSRSMTLTEQGWFEEEGLLVTLDNWGKANHRRVEIVVTDPCGRQGTAIATDWTSS